MFSTAKTLIVVYKDEMLMNQLKKLVETNDDIDGENIVGTKDDSINIVSWSEKVWLGNKKAGNIKEKVLFLGDIKETDMLIPVIDIKFDDYGVKYGWAGNQAIVYADTKVLEDRNKYKEFVLKIADYPIPDIIKKPQNLSVDNNDDKDVTEPPAVSKNDGESTPQEVKTKNIFDMALEALASGADAVGKAGNSVALLAEDIFRDRTAVKRQMLFYGVVNLYRDGLQQFMQL